MAKTLTDDLDENDYLFHFCEKMSWSPKTFCENLVRSGETKKCNFLEVILMVKHGCGSLMVWSYFTDSAP